MNGVVAIRNAQPTEVRLVLEPWAEEQLVPAGTVMTILFDGPSGGRLEVEFKPGEIIVYGWEGSVISFADTR
jgi:hypothetical protein